MIISNEKLLEKYKVYKASQDHERRSFLAKKPKRKAKPGQKARKRNKKIQIIKYYKSKLHKEITRQNDHIRELNRIS
jgi:hypothetical protein